MVSRYPGKEVVVAEVGGDYTAVQNTYAMLLAMQQAVRAIRGWTCFIGSRKGQKAGAATS
jgi:hypothetical protein